MSLEQHSSRWIKWAAAGALAIGALGATAAANAGVSWSVGVAAPGVVVGVNQPGYYAAPQPYYAPAPAYYAPPPVYYRPPPVYYRPAPVYYAPAPAYYGPGPGYYRHHRHHGHGGWR